MLKQFVVVIPNVLTIVNKMTPVEAVHMDGAYQCDKCDFVKVKREELKSHLNHEGLI